MVARIRPRPDVQELETLRARPDRVERAPGDEDRRAWAQPARTQDQLSGDDVDDLVKVMRMRLDGRVRWQLHLEQPQCSVLARLMNTELVRQLLLGQPRQVLR